MYFGQTTNSRETDVLLALKGHYRNLVPLEQGYDIELLRIVYSIHNGVEPSVVKDADMILMMTNEKFLEAMFPNSRSLALFFNDTVRQVAWEPNIKPVRLLVQMLSGKLAMTSKDDLNVKELPEPCEKMKGWISKVYAEYYKKSAQPA